MQEIVIEKLIDVQARVSKKDPAHECIEYCINMIAAGKLYQMQSDLLLEEDDEDDEDDDEEDEINENSGIVRSRASHEISEENEHIKADNSLQ